MPGVVFGEGAECGSSRQLSAGEDTLLSLQNTSTACLRKAKSIDVIAICKQEL